MVFQQDENICVYPTGGKTIPPAPLTNAWIITYLINVGYGANWCVYTQNSGGYQLSMQTDGNFCLHGGNWCAYTQGSWGTSTYAQIQNNGVFGVYTGAGVLIKGSIQGGTEGTIPI